VVKNMVFNKVMILITGRIIAITGLDTYAMRFRSTRQYI